MENHWALRDKAAIAGIGQTKFYKRAASPISEFELACQAIINAAEDAGIAVRDIDGLTTFAGANWDSDLMANVLGMKELRFANNAWTGGGADSTLEWVSVSIAVSSAISHGTVTEVVVVVVLVVALAAALRALLMVHMLPLARPRLSPVAPNGLVNALAKLP